MTTPTRKANPVTDTSRDEIEALRRERDEARRLVNDLSDDITFLRKRRGDLVREKDAAEAALTEIRAMLAEAVGALEPFSGCIFNDNGDITVNFRSFRYDELVAAYFVHRRARSTYNKIKEAGHAAG
jgi:hypothetical protein